MMMISMCAESFNLCDESCGTRHLSRVCRVRIDTGLDLTVGQLCEGALIVCAEEQLRGRMVRHGFQLAPRRWISSLAGASLHIQIFCIPQSALYRR